MSDDGRMDVARFDGGRIKVELAGDPDATPVLYCHGLAESRLAVRRMAQASGELGLRLIAPDRPGTGGTDLRRLERVADWVDDALLVLDALDVPTAHVLGISGGGAFAAACAARAPERFSHLTLISALGPPAWSTYGMALGQRGSLRLARRTPAFGGWFLDRLATLARHAPGLYFGIATVEMPDADKRALARPEVRADFRANYLEAFRRGGAGVAQDLRLLTRPWGFELHDIAVPTVVHHGDADTTVPLDHGRRYAASIPGARLRIYPGHGHFSIPPRFGRLYDRPAAPA